MEKIPKKVFLLFLGRIRTRSHLFLTILKIFLKFVFFVFSTPPPSPLVRDFLTSAQSFFSTLEFLKPCDEVSKKLLLDRKWKCFYMLCLIHIWDKVNEAMPLDHNILSVVTTWFIAVTSLPYKWITQTKT